MKKLGVTVILGFVLLLPTMASAAQEPKALPLPDERYKVDLLLVVAHPDDEGAATPYLARALDEHRRIAVVFGTRGSSGANEDRKSTRLNSSHSQISYAVFCLKKKK